MLKHWIIKGIKYSIFIIVSGIVLGYFVQLLWNWLMPSLFPSISAINFYQAIGLVILSKILFGGFHKGGCGHCHCHGHSMKSHWRSKLESKMEHMTPEEKENFKLKLKDKCKGWFEEGKEC